MTRYLLVALLSAGLGATGVRVYASPAKVPTIVADAARDSAASAAGIAALHRADSVATVAHDPKLLAELWDSAAVRIEVGGPTTTRKTIITNDSLFFAHNPGVGVVQYQSHILNVSVHDGIGIEWGYFESEYVTKAGAKAQYLRGNVMRGLRRQADGTWKFTHVMWVPAQ